MTDREARVRFLASDQNVASTLQKIAEETKRTEVEFERLGNAQVAMWQKGGKAGQDALIAYSATGKSVQDLGQTISGQIDSIAAKQAQAATAAEKLAEAEVKAATTAAAAVEKAALQKAAAFERVVVSAGAVEPRLAALTQGVGALTGGVSAMTLGVAAGAVALGVMGVKAAESAAELQHQQTILKAFLEFRGQGDAFAAVNEGLDKLRVRGQLAGASISDLNEAYRRGFEHTQDANAALELTNLSLAVATTNGRTLHQVLQGMDAAVEGNTRSLRLLGVEIKNVDADYIRTLPRHERVKEILALMAEQYGGLTKELDTFQTHQAQLDVNLQKLQQNIGAGLLPYLDEFVKGVLALGKAFDESGQGYAKLAQALAIPIKPVVDPEQLNLIERLVQLTGGQARPDFLPSSKISGIAPPAGVTEAGGLPGGATADLHKQAVEQYDLLHTAIKEKEEKIREQYRQSREAAKDRWDSELAEAKASAEGQREEIRKSEQWLRDSIRGETEAEAARHTAEGIRIRDGQKAELDALEERKRGWEAWAVDKKRQIDDTVRDDLAGTKAAKEAEDAAFDARKKNAERTADEIKTALANNLHAAEQQAELDKRTIDRRVEADTQAREKQKQIAVDALKEQTTAAENAYREQSFAFQQAHKEDEFVIDQTQKLVLQGIDDETKARDRAHSLAVRNLEDEQRLEERRIQAQIKGIDDVAAARKYAEQAQAAGYGVQHAAFALATAQAAGEDPNKILELRQALLVAQQRQEDVFYANIDRQEKDALQNQLTNDKDAARSAKEALDDEYRDYKDDQDRRKRDLQTYYDTINFQREQDYDRIAHQRETDYQLHKQYLERQIQIEERAAQAEEQAWANEAKSRKDQIDDKLNAQREYTREQSQLIDKDKQAAVDAIDAEQKAAHAYWEARTEDVRKWKIEQDRLVDDAKTLNINLINAEKSAAEARWRGEADEEAKTHTQITQDIEHRKQAAENEYADAKVTVAADLAVIQEALKATYGDVPGGATRLYNDAERAALAAYEAEKKLLDHAKAEGHAGGAAGAFAAIADEIGRIGDNADEALAAINRLFGIEIPQTAKDRPIAGPGQKGFIGPTAPPGGPNVLNPDEEEVGFKGFGPVRGTGIDANNDIGGPDLVDTALKALRVVVVGGTYGAASAYAGGAASPLGLGRGGGGPSDISGPMIGNLAAFAGSISPQDILLPYFNTRHYGDPGGQEPAIFGSPFGPRDPENPYNPFVNPFGAPPAPGLPGQMAPVTAAQFAPDPYHASTQAFKDAIDRTNRSIDTYNQKLQEAANARQKGDERVAKDAEAAAATFRDVTIPALKANAERLAHSTDLLGQFAVAVNTATAGMAAISGASAKGLSGPTSNPILAAQLWAARGFLGGPISENPLDPSDQELIQRLTGRYDPASLSGGVPNIGGPGGVIAGQLGPAGGAGGVPGAAGGAGGAGGAGTGNLPAPTPIGPTGLGRYQHGGIVYGPELAIVGEGGLEPILPANDPARMTQILGQLPPEAFGNVLSAVGAAYHGHYGVPPPEAIGATTSGGPSHAPGYGPQPSEAIGQLSSGGPSHRPGSLINVGQTTTGGVSANPPSITASAPSGVVVGEGPVGTPSVGSATGTAVTINVYSTIGAEVAAERIANRMVRGAIIARKSGATGVRYND